MSLYSRLAEQLQYISPSFYKARFFKKLNGISTENIHRKNIEPEMLWLKNLLKNDSVFLDVGANVGAYLYLIEDVVDAKNIFAFEPNPRLYKRLQRLFKNVNISPVALSDKNGTDTFKIPVINGRTVSSRGTLNAGYREADETSATTQQVQISRLDELDFIKNLDRIDFIKVDVEGHEAAMLRGAKKTIEKFKPMMMVEIEQRHHTQPVWELITEIISLGYTANFLDRESLQPAPLTRGFLEKQNAANVKNYGEYINNIIFLPV